MTMGNLIQGVKGMLKIAAYVALFSLAIIGWSWVVDVERARQDPPAERMELDICEDCQGTGREW
jgi:hypothetical protein